MSRVILFECGHGTPPILFIYDMVVVLSIRINILQSAIGKKFQTEERSQEFQIICIAVVPQPSKIYQFFRYDKLLPYQLLQRR